MWSAEPDLDTDGDGLLDAVGLDFDDDGLTDDALVDTDADGLADHAVLDVDGTRRWFIDDGTGMWAVPAVDRGAPLRWLSLDGIESTGGPLVDFDADGAVDDLLVER